jgi:hypothetical protein
MDQQGSTAGSRTWSNRRSTPVSKSAGLFRGSPLGATEYNAGFMNGQGTIVGYGTIRWIALGNGQFRVNVR